MEYSLQVVGSEDWLGMSWLEEELRDGRRGFVCSAWGKRLACVAYCHEHVSSKSHRRYLGSAYPCIRDGRVSLRECPCLLLVASAGPPVSVPGLAAFAGEVAPVVLAPISLPANTLMVEGSVVSRGLVWRLCRQAALWLSWSLVLVAWLRSLLRARLPRGRVLIRQGLLLTAAPRSPPGVFVPRGWSHSQGPFMEEDSLKLQKRVTFEDSVWPPAPPPPRVPLRAASSPPKSVTFEDSVWPPAPPPPQAPLPAAFSLLMLRARHVGCRL